MIGIVNLKIAALSKRLNRVEDRKDLESIRQLIIALNEENERLRQEAAMRDYGNSEQINHMHEQIRNMENKLGYYK